MVTVKVSEVTTPRLVTEPTPGHSSDRGLTNDKDKAGTKESRVSSLYVDGDYYGGGSRGQGELLCLIPASEETPMYLQNAFAQKTVIEAHSPKMRQAAAYRKLNQANV